MDPLLKKLQYKGGPVVVLDAPDELADPIGHWRAEGVPVADRLPAGRARSVGFALVFVEMCEDIDTVAPKVVRRLSPDDPLLWFAYPKKSSKRYRSDIGRDDSWGTLGELGFEGVRMVAVDQDWSAIRLRRVEDIPSLTRDPSGALSRKGKERTSG